MGHLNHSVNDAYDKLVQRIQKNPIGAPVSPTLFKILKILYNEREAEIGSKFPMLPSTIEQVEANIDMPREQLIKHLDEMADRGLVADIDIKGTVYYLLSPIVVGFFEYTLMRTDDRLPLKELSALFEQYFHEKGVPEEIFGSDTKMFQTWAYEKLMPGDVETEVLNYEKASEMIRDSGGGGISPCACRRKASLLEHKSCDHPIDVCTSLGYAGRWLISHNLARPATADELLRILDDTEKRGLVHLADNVRKNPAYICHCCGCCCGVLRSITEAGVFSIQPSNFIAVIDNEKCNGCGVCSKKCHINAIDIVEEIPGDKKSRKAVLNSDLCIGCGVCVEPCKKDAIVFLRREDIYEPPKNKTEQMMRIAIERGRI